MALTKQEIIETLYSLREEISEIKMEGKKYIKDNDGIWTFNGKNIIIKPAKWYDRGGRSSMKPPIKIFWIHDHTGEKYKEAEPLLKKYPECVLMWVEGVYGGNTFVAGDLEFETINSVRGKDYEAVLAFDEDGYGCVFYKEK